MEVESEDDEVLKPACVKKSTGHWQVTSRDVMWPHLPALRSYSWPDLQIWLASPGAVT